MPTAQVHLRRPTRGSGLLETYLANRRVSMVESLIPITARAGRILDLGCGATAYFLSRTHFAEKIGLERDVTSEDIGRAAQRGIKVIRHNLLDCNSLPFDDEYFDVVTMMAVVEHISRKVALSVVSSVLRVLRMNGILIVTTPNKWTDTLLRLLARVGAVSREEIDEHQELYTRDSLRLLLEEAGFSRAAIKTGCFEMGMNLWGMSSKR